MYTDLVAIKRLIQHYKDSSFGANEGKGKCIVSARIHVSSNKKLESLADQFGVKKSSLAAELLEAAIDEASEEADRNH